MADTAAAQLKRVLDLIPRLADDAEHSFEEVAAAAGTRPSQILADLTAISERYDAPGGFVEGVSILVEERTVSVHANHFLRPMRLTMPELCAIELGLTMLRRERTPAEQAPLERALARLRHAISQVPSNDRYEGTRYGDLADAGSAEHLAVLRGALREQRMLELRYRAGGSTTSATRRIAPHSLHYADQMWYVAATGEHDGVRFFRLDRVESVRLLDATFERDATIGERVQEAGRAFVSDTARRMTVRYSPRIARWIAEREGVPVQADGSLTLEHPVADESWAVRHVLQYGPDAELLDPPELRAALRERLETLAATRA
ncbi:MAG: WYL domain-containing protein [bacterium]